MPAKRTGSNPKTKTNSGDTKGYAEENPGRQPYQAGKQTKQASAAEEIASRKIRRSK